jgi:hypothetical protein
MFLAALVVLLSVAVVSNPAFSGSARSAFVVRWR